MIPIIGYLQDAVAKTGVEVQHHFRIPWILIIIVLMVIAGLAVLDTACSGESAPTAQPEQQVSTSPVITPLIDNTQQEVIAPVIQPEIKTPWVLIGIELPVMGTLDRLKIPWKRFFHVTTQMANEEFQFPGGQAIHGYGDRGSLTLLVQAQDGTFYLTVDHGKIWYPISEKPPVNERYGLPLSEPIGVYQDGGKVVMYVKTDSPQTKKDPFLAAFWKNEVLFSNLKGLAP